MKRKEFCQTSGKEAGTERNLKMYMFVIFQFHNRIPKRKMEISYPYRIYIIW